MIPKAEAIIQWAIEIAEGLPEEYQVVAFTELLQHALKSMSYVAESGAGEPPLAATLQPASQPLLERLVSELPDDYLVAAQGSRDHQTVWAAVKLWQQGKEVTSASVIDCVKTNLCIQPEGTGNTSTRLRNLTPRYLSRAKREEGQGYVYQPTPNASEIFEDLE